MPFTSLSTLTSSPVSLHCDNGLSVAVKLLLETGIREGRTPVSTGFALAYCLFK